MTPHKCEVAVYVILCVELSTETSIIAYVATEHEARALCIAANAFEIESMRPGRVRQLLEAIEDPMDQVALLIATSDDARRLYRSTYTYTRVKHASVVSDVPPPDYLANLVTSQ